MFRDLDKEVGLPHISGRNHGHAKYHKDAVFMGKVDISMACPLAGDSIADGLMSG